MGQDIGPSLGFYMHGTRHRPIAVSLYAWDNIERDEKRSHIRAPSGIGTQGPSLSPVDTLGYS
jgi:hypothetical protein